MYDTRARRVGDARGADGMRIGGSGIGAGGIRMPSMAGSAGSLAMASSAESFANFGSPGSLGIGIGESNEADRGMPAGGLACVEVGGAEKAERGEGCSVVLGCLVVATVGVFSCFRISWSLP